MNIYEYQNNARKKLLDMLSTNLINKDEANEFTKRVYDAQSEADIDAILDEARNLHSRVNKSEIEHETRELYKALRQDREADDDAFVRTRDGSHDASIYDEVLGTSDEEEEQEDDVTDEVSDDIVDEEPTEEKEKKKKKKSKKAPSNTDNTDPYGKKEADAPVSSTARFEKNQQEAEWIAEDAAKKAAKDAEYANRHATIEEPATVVPPRSEYKEPEVLPMSEYKEPEKTPIVSNVQDPQIAPTYATAPTSEPVKPAESAPYTTPSYQEPARATEPNVVPTAPVAEAPKYAEPAAPAYTSPKVEEAPKVETPAYQPTEAPKTTTPVQDTPAAPGYTAPKVEPAGYTPAAPKAATPTYTHQEPVQATPVAPTAPVNESRPAEPAARPVYTQEKTTVSTPGYTAPVGTPESVRKTTFEEVKPAGTAPVFKPSQEPFRAPTSDVEQTHIHGVPTAETRNTAPSVGSTPRQNTVVDAKSPVSAQGEIVRPVVGAYTPDARHTTPAESGISGIQEQGRVAHGAPIFTDNRKTPAPVITENMPMQQVIAERIAAKATAMENPVVKNSPLMQAIPTEGYAVYTPGINKVPEVQDTQVHREAHVGTTPKVEPTVRSADAPKGTPVAPVGATRPVMDEQIHVPVSNSHAAQIFDTAKTASAATTAQHAQTVAPVAEKLIVENTPIRTSTEVPVYQPEVKTTRTEMQSNVAAAHAAHQGFRREEAAMITHAVSSNPEYHTALSTARTEAAAAKTTLDTARVESRRIESDIIATTTQLRADRSELTAARKEMLSQADTVASMARSVTAAEQTVVTTRAKMEAAKGADVKAAETAYNNAVADLSAKKVSYERLQAQHQVTAERVQALNTSVQAGTAKIEQLNAAHAKAQGEVAQAVAVHSIKTGTVQQLEAYGTELAHNYAKTGATVVHSDIKTVISGIKANETAQLQAAQTEPVQSGVFARVKENTEAIKTQHLAEIRQTAAMAAADIPESKTHPAAYSPGYTNTVKGTPVTTVFSEGTITTVAETKAPAVLSNAVGRAAVDGSKQDIRIAIADDGTKYAMHSNGFIEPVVMPTKPVIETPKHTVILADGTKLTPATKTDSAYHVDDAGNKYTRISAGNYQRIDDTGALIGKAVATDEVATRAIRTGDVKPVAVVLSDGTQLSTPVKTAESSYRIASDNAGNKYALTEAGIYHRVDEKGTPIGAPITVDAKATKAIYQQHAEPARPVSVVLTDGTKLSVSVKTADMPTRIATDAAGNKYQLTAAGSYQRIDDKGAFVGSALSVDKAATQAAYRADNAARSLPNQRIALDTAGNKYAVLETGLYQPLDAQGKAIGQPVSAPIAQNRAATSVVLMDGTKLSTPVATGSHMIAVDAAGNKYSAVAPGVYQRLNDFGNPVGNVIQSASTVTAITLPNGTKLTMQDATPARVAVMENGGKLILTSATTPMGVPAGKAQVQFAAIDEAGNKYAVIGNGTYQRIDDKGNRVGIPVTAKEVVQSITLPDGSRIAVPGTIPAGKAPQLNIDNKTGATSGVATKPNTHPAETVAKTGPTTSAGDFAPTAKIAAADAKTVANTVIDGNKLFYTNAEGRTVVLNRKKLEGMSEEQRAEHITKAFEKQSKKPINTASERPNPKFEYIDVDGIKIRVTKDKWAKMSAEERSAYIANLVKNKGFVDIENPILGDKEKVLRKEYTDKSGRFKAEFGSIKTFYSQRLMQATNRLAGSLGHQPMMVFGNLYRGTDFGAATSEAGRYAGAIGLILAAPGAKMLAKDLARDIAMRNNLLQQVKNGANLSLNMSRGEFMRIDAEANGFKFHAKDDKMFTKSLTRAQARAVSGTLELKGIEEFLLKNQKALDSHTVAMLRNGTFFSISSLKDVQNVRASILRALTASGGGVPLDISRLSVRQLKDLIASGRLNAEQIQQVRALIGLDKLGKQFQQQKNAIRSRNFKITMLARSIFMQTDMGQAVNMGVMVTKGAYMIGKTGVAFARFGGKLVMLNTKTVVAVRDKMRLSGLKKATKKGDLAKLEKLEAKIKKTEALRQKKLVRKDKVDKLKSKISDKLHVGRRVKTAVKDKFAKSAVGKAANKVANSALGKAISAPFKFIAKAGAAIKKVAVALATGVGYFILFYVILLGVLMACGEGVFALTSWLNSDKAPEKVQAAVAEINALESEFMNYIGLYYNEAPRQTDLEGNPIPNYSDIDTYYFNYDFTQLSQAEQERVKREGDSRYAAPLSNGRYIMSYAAVFFLQDFNSVSESALKDYSSALWKATHLVSGVESSLYPCEHTNCKATYFNCLTPATTTLANKYYSQDTVKMVNEYQSRFYNIGGCHYVYHRDTNVTIDTDWISGDQEYDWSSTKYLYVGSSQYRGAKAGAAYYSTASDGSKLALPVNELCSDFKVVYCSSAWEYYNEIPGDNCVVQVEKKTTYHQCLGHTDAQGVTTYHNDNITHNGHTYDNLTSTACSNSEPIVLSTYIRACRGHFKCREHYYCPGDHVLEYCTGHVDLDVHAIVFDFDDLYDLCVSLTNDNLGRTTGPVPTLQNSNMWVDWHGYAYKGTDFINFEDGFLASIFPGGVTKQREKFLAAGGWTQEKKDIVWNIARQDWKELYQVQFAGEYIDPDSAMETADIQAFIQERLPHPTQNQKALVYNALGLVGRVHYFWGGGHDRLVKGWDDNWGSMRMVTAAGSSIWQKGQWYQYGLDCSGYVRWVYYNTYGIDIYDYITGLDDFMDPNNPTVNGQPAFVEVSLADARIGDIVVYGDFSHTGIFMGYKPNGSLGSDGYFSVAHSTPYGSDGTLLTSGVVFNHSLSNQYKFTHIYRLNYRAFGINP